MPVGSRTAKSKKEQKPSETLRVILRVILGSRENSGSMIRCGALRLKVGGGQFKLFSPEPPPMLTLKSFPTRYRYSILFSYPTLVPQCVYGEKFTSCLNRHFSPTHRISLSGRY